MLTLAQGSACDVCAEEYGQQCMPHSIPCGHVLCASCCTTIVEKTSSRLSPACPFCRESFTSDSVRLIRMDFTTSGWTTPRRYPQYQSHSDFTGELLTKRAEQLLRLDSDSRVRPETRRLEDKVARIAMKKCSVEEVSALHKELEEWLASEKNDQTSSLFLSAALLRAILMNHTSHSESRELAKQTESSLKRKVDDLQSTTSRLEADLKRQRTLYHQKSQECQQLRTEVSQLRALATTLGVSVPPTSTTSSSASTTTTTTTSSASASAAASASASSSTNEPTTPTRATSPTAPYAPNTPSPLSARYTSLHSRSISMTSASASASASAAAATRPATPAIPSPLSRTQTPGPGHHSHSSSLLSHSSSLRSPTRSATPAVGLGSSRPYTPAPMMTSRSMTPGPGHHYLSSTSTSTSASAAAAAAAAAYRSQTPAPGHGSSYYSHSSSHSHRSPSTSSHAYPSHSSYSTPMVITNGGYPTTPMTPAPTGATTNTASSTAQPPVPPPKPRRLSQPSPPKMMVRSTSSGTTGGGEEKADGSGGVVHRERWIPPDVARMMRPVGTVRT